MKILSYVHLNQLDNGFTLSIAWKENDDYIKQDSFCQSYKQALDKITYYLADNYAELTNNKKAYGDEIND